MKITLNAEQQEKLLDWARVNTAAEIEADCEPSGYTLEINVSPYEVNVEAVCGSRRLDLGEAKLERSPAPTAGLIDDLVVEGNGVRRRMASMARSNK
jgi:hypothetical protein